jgi:aspartate beta-hydroxylase
VTQSRVVQTLPEQRAEVERRLAAGDLARAVQLSETLLLAHPADPEVQVLHASALMARGDWLLAAQRLEETSRRADAPYAAKARLALCRVMLGDGPGALQAYRMALAERPGDFVQRLGYAECLAANGAADEALPQFYRAICDAQKLGRWLADASTPPYLRERVHKAMDIVDTGRQALFAQVLEPHVATHGPEAMRRIRESLAIHLGLAPAPVSDPRQQPTFFRMIGPPSTPYFDRALFSWYEALEEATPAIQEELRQVLDTEGVLIPFLGDFDADTTDPYLGGNPGSRSWDAYFLHRHGRRFEDHLARCPKTAAALEQVPLTVVRDHAPEVLFSILAPDTHIKPHHGVTNTRVVTHLPLLVPDGDCHLVVGGQPHGWREGHCITFDDTFLHEAWNRTGHRRVVMILDTWNPYLTQPECAALRDLIERIGDFNLQAGAR